MILDGYTLYGGFDSRRFLYRPAKYWERRGVIQYLRGPKSEQVARDFLRRKVVWSETGWETWRESEQELLALICLGVHPPEWGGDWAEDWEERDEQNLYEGVLLFKQFPQFASRSCESCKKWWYDDDTGKIATRQGKPLRRPEGSVLLCQTMAGCPNGTPENRRGLSPKNRMAWQHFRECEAVGQFPDDALVRANALIIKKAIKAAEISSGH